MKNLLLLHAFLFLFVQTGVAQAPLLNQFDPVPIPESVHPGENFSQSGPTVPGNTTTPAMFKGDDTEIQIGSTQFDLQTVGCNGRKLQTYDDKVSAIWLFGNDPNGFPDRGTGYNHYDGTEWQQIPTERMEGATRGGYPDMTVLGDGTEVIVSHTTRDAGGWEVKMYQKAPGTDAWVQSTVPSVESFGGMVWAKVATGGPDGNSIHLIAVTLNEAFGGMPYRGLEQHILYYRSTDAGKSWDITDMVIPGLDSSFYFTHDSEAYSIDVQGETVAVAVFTGWGDTALFKSEDNGTTWAKTTIIDFPLDAYNQMGYTAGDLPNDPNAPDSLAIFTNDGFGSLVLDDNGMAHVSFGEMYVTDPGNGQFQFFPGMSGLAYWNESMGTGNYQTIADLQDFDGDSMVTVSDIATYFLSLTAMPSIGIDADGNLYVAYSALHELYTNSDGQNYRHIYLVESQDGGMNWTTPYPVINEETLGPDIFFFIDFLEAVYPSIPRRVGEKVQMLYQQDFEPGLSQSGDMDAPMDNSMNFLAVDKQNIRTSSVEPNILSSEKLRVFPNPALDRLTVDFTLTGNSETTVSVFDLLGTRVFEKDLGMRNSGRYVEMLDLAFLKTGIYFLRIRAGDNFVSRKIILE